MLDVLVEQGIELTGLLGLVIVAVDVFDHLLPLFLLDDPLKHEIDEKRHLVLLADIQVLVDPPYLPDHLCELLPGLVIGN